MLSANLKGEGDSEGEDDSKGSIFNGSGEIDSRRKGKKEYERKKKKVHNFTNR